MEKYVDVVIPQSLEWGEEVKAKALANMQKYDSCAQSVLAAYMEVLNIDNPMVVRSAGAMHGGMVSSLTCGIHTSAMMILGLLMGREEIEDGVDGLMPIIQPGQNLLERLNKKLGSHSCKELTGVDFTDHRQARKYRISGEYNRCVERVGEGAEVIAQFFAELEERGEIFRPTTITNSTKGV